MANDAKPCSAQILCAAEAPIIAVWAAIGQTGYMARRRTGFRTAALELWTEGQHQRAVQSCPARRLSLRFGNFFGHSGEVVHSALILGCCCGRKSTFKSRPVKAGPRYVVSQPSEVTTLLARLEFRTKSIWRQNHNDRIQMRTYFVNGSTGPELLSF